MLPSAEELYDNATADLSQVFYALHIKSLLALPASILTHYLASDVSIFIIYLFIMFLDLIAGVAKALKTKTFRAQYLNRWVLKLGTQIFVIFLFGLTYYAFFLASGITFPILNYLVFILLITESVSIIDNMTKCGLPVPPIVRYLLNLIRRKAVNSVVSNIDLKEETPPEEEPAPKEEQL
jgi:phage-related holin